MKVVSMIMLGVICLCISCAKVKPFQLSKINHPEMVMSSQNINTMESSFQSYREGASGANGGKVGGGCGCN